MRQFFRRLLRNKRALTPVLSELLLTIVAVSAMSVATTATYVITANMRDNMSERVVIEDVWFDSATGKVNIYLVNIGEIDIEITAVYLNHTAAGFGAPFALQMDTHDWLNATYTWTPGGLYYVDVLTSRGLHIADYYNAP